MTDTTLPGAGLSRRGLLKVGLFGSAFLATAGVTASLSGCSASVPASGLATLRLTLKQTQGHNVETITLLQQVHVDNAP